MAASSHDKTLPDNCITTDLPGLAGKRWVKGAALYGANASGKTTVLEALEALAGMVRTSAGITDPKEPISQIDPFGLAPGEPETPTAFALAFVADGVRYEYRVAATRERVWHESLRAFPKAKEQIWFNRDWNAGSEAYEWSPERPSGFQRDPQLEGYTLANVLFLSKAVANNRPELDPVFRWFRERVKFLDLRPGNRVGLRFTLKRVQEQTPLHDRIVALLRHADLGVTDARAIERRPPDEEVEKIAADLPPEMRERILKDRWLQPELLHRGSKSANLPLPWDTESAGTHRFFGLTGPWLDILSNGYTLCADELETSMHPIMVYELLKLFFSAEHNPNGAQILFTTHNPLLLDPTLMRRDQVWFTDKKDTGESFLYPLTDYQPRKGESLVRGYMSGRYGAVPFVPAGLLGSFPTHGAAESTEKAPNE
ncbi:MAG TPA: ATP-binding protein [Verrucomicrobiota bacterium]|nr:ATP-binding protein [Verrucomicrobiota bacterium]